jgi:S1-C subfamily serine protease
MRIFRNVLLLIWLSGTAGSFAHAQSLPDIIERVQPAVVGVGSYRQHQRPGAKNPGSTLNGTGFAVDNGLYVITNAHVLPKDLDESIGEKIAVFSGQGKRSKIHLATVAAQNQAHDLAVLRIDPPALPTLAIGDSATVRVGERVGITGFPIGSILGLYPATHIGIVSAVTPMAIPAPNATTITAAQMRRMRNPLEVFQLDITAYPGNSGSPVFNTRDGVVLGVLNSVVVKESKESLLTNPSGISYAIPAVHVRALLRDAKSKATGN